MALEKLDGVSSVFVNDGITVLVDNDQPLDQAKLKATLEPFKIKLSGVDKAAELPF